MNLIGWQLHKINVESREIRKFNLLQFQIIKVQKTVKLAEKQGAEGRPGLEVKYKIQYINRIEK